MAASPPPLPPALPLEMRRAAEDAGLVLEIVAGVPLWSPWPSPLHQMALVEVRDGVRGAEIVSQCWLDLSPTSRRLPDLLLYRALPPLTPDPLAVPPDAIVEILSPGGERKDLDLGPRDYLAHGVRDVIVVDPESGVATHFRREGATPRRRGDTVLLECGCEVTL